MSDFTRKRRIAALIALALLAAANLLLWTRMAHAELLIIDAAAVSLLVLLFCGTMMHGGIRTLAALALLTALSVVLSRLLSINTHSLRLGLGNVPIILAGLLYGAFGGALVGFAADLTGALLLSSFGYMPLLALSPLLTGAIPALLRPVLMRKRVSPLRLGLTIACTHAVTSVGWSSYCIHLLYGTPLRELLTLRTPLYALMTMVETAVIFAMVRSGAFRARGLTAEKKEKDA